MKKQTISLIEWNKKNKLYHDKKIKPSNLNENDFILLKKEPYNKFNAVYAGPYRVKRIENENIVFEINNKEHKIHKNRVVKAFNNCSKQ